MLDKILLITTFMLLFVTIESYEVSSVSCGNHRASSCSACPQGNGKSWCHGSCRWQNGQCSPIPHGKLDNLGKDCWKKCDQRQGHCNWCGSEGFCCTSKNGWTDFSNGCDGTFGGSTRHECSAHKPGSGSSHRTSYAQQELRKHNTYRARHGAPPLSLDSSLSADAEYYARVLLSKGDLEHSHGDYGENLSIKCDGSSATDGWYKEVKNYNYGNPGYADNTGHFTQVVWKGSKRLGVGTAKGKWYVNGIGYDCEFIVARYTPAGNVGGAFPENVRRP